jgi:hypothetical protein
MMLDERSDQPSPTLRAVARRTGNMALVQTSFVLIACAMVGALSGQGAAPYLGASIAVFEFSGSVVLGRALSSEWNARRDMAGKLYALALVHYSTSYVAFLAFLVFEAVTES